MKAVNQLAKYEILDVTKTDDGNYIVKVKVEPSNVYWKLEESSKIVSQEKIDQGLDAIDPEVFASVLTESIQKSIDENVYGEASTIERRCSMFIYFFGIIFACAMFIIWKSWQRHNTFSAGYYKNTGQNIIVWCDKSFDEIIKLLNNKSQNDTLMYDFYMDNECGFLNVQGICRLQTKTILPVLFKLEFIQGEKGTYLVAKLVKRSQILYSTRFEVELYEFFEKKIGSVPRRSIDG